MVIVGEGDTKYYLNKILKSNLDIIKKAVTKDRDCLLIVDGKEREGKSTLACQIAKYLDPTYNVDRCCFTAEDFIDAVKSVKERYKAVVLDEGMAFTSRSALSKLNRALIRVLAEIGMKNLFLIICIPSFFELDKYAAIHRSQALLHVYPKEFKRGQFVFWNYNGKRLLYFHGKKFYSYSKPNANFVGDFIKRFPIDKEAYDIKKREIIDRMEVDDPRHTKWKAQRDLLIKLLYEKKVMSQTEIGKSLKDSGFGLEKSTISELLLAKRG